jgi:hypothetical protein
MFLDEKALENLLEEMMVNEMLDFLNDDVRTTEDLLDEIEALEAAKETTVEVLVDSVCYNKKPAGKTIASITKRLPQNKQTITLEDLAQAAANGRSWKAAVMSDTTNNSFVSSSLVALDIDNKESYTSINEFLVASNKYQPCFIYETFSSTKEHNRYRVAFAFDKTITDYNEMVALYEEVKAQYPTVDIDPSVDPGKILFGGKALSFFNNVVNETPVVKAVEKALRTTKSSNVKDTNHESIEIDKDTVLENLAAMEEQYADVQELDINEAYKWINEHVKMTDVLGIEENVRFRCILPDHADNNPSARITTNGEEQVYMCSCDACGYRLITLLSKLLDMSEVKVKMMILDALNISFGSEYQKATERYIADVRRNANKMLPQYVLDYLNRRKLYRAYRLIIDFADAHIAYQSLSNEDDRVVFFLGQRCFKEEMKQNFIAGSAEAKLTTLCELGFLRKLPDSEIRKDALNNAYNQRSALKNLNRVDFYELIDLSPSVIDGIQARIKYMEDNYVRQRGNNINRRINTFGEEVVLSEINVQATVNTKKQNKIETRLRNTVDELLENNKLFNESDLSKAYRATDKKHITKKDADQVVLDFIPVFAQENIITRVRVNKATRKQYDIPETYKSNTFIYIKVC